MNLTKNKPVLLQIKRFLSIPFRIIRRINNWMLSDPVVPGSLEQRFPKAVFQNPKNIFVGERVYIGVENLFIANRAAITIGDDTMIAPRVTITTATHDPAQNPMWKTSISRPVSIGKHVWIGIGAIILPGVQIGDYAIIGAGAVVSRHVPDKAVVVGNPAHIIRYREVPQVDTDTQKRYPFWENVLEDYLPSTLITKSQGKEDLAVSQNQLSDVNKDHMMEMN